MRNLKNNWQGGDCCVDHRTDFHCLLRCDADASEEEVQLCQERTAELSALINEFILRKNALGITVSLLCLCLPARFLRRAPCLFLVAPLSPPGHAKAGRNRATLVTPPHRRPHQHAAVPAPAAQGGREGMLTLLCLC